MPPTATAAVTDRRIQLNTLTGMRGVFSFVVLLGHNGAESYFADDRINRGLVRTLIGPGEAAVALFFMLSGFVLVWAARPGDTPKSFLRRRFMKIYPNHLVTWTAGLLGMLAFGKFTGVLNVLPSLALVHVWVPNGDTLSGTNGPAWSLGCEMVFYLLFPWMLPRVLRIAQDRLWRWLIGCCVGLVAVTLLAAATLSPAGTMFGLPISLQQFYVLIFFPPVRMFDFLLGMIVAQLVITGRWVPVRGRWIALAGVAGLALNAVTPAPIGFVVFFVPVNLLMLGTAATMDIRKRPSFLTWRSVVWLGDVSFALYLVHYLVIHYGRLALGGGPWSTPQAALFLVANVMVSIGLAELMRRHVELPMMAKFARPRRRTPAVPASASSVPASSVPASSVPASSVPASSVPASSVPAGAELGGA
jgi:peptidoglycan/LPS O-acetylase OafA/YrhL